MGTKRYTAAKNYAPAMGNKRCTTAMSYTQAMGHKRYMTIKQLYTSTVHTT